MSNLKLPAKLVSLFFFLLVFQSCLKMSEHIEDSTAGLNGSFEISQDGLPVNWLLYTPNIVPKSEFEMLLDTKIYKDGKQSLKFKVNRCTETGGWMSPGFTNQFFDKGEGIYKLSMWVKNEESEFIISAGGVSYNKGNMITLIKSKEQISDWKLLEYEIEVPSENSFRLEVNILQPGTFWIDDIRIDKL